MEETCTQVVPIKETEVVVYQIRYVHEHLRSLAMSKCWNLGKDL